jgi:hypothetical protein
MMVSKLVDYLVVELAYDDGYDMYADGSALALANLISRWPWWSAIPLPST